MSADYRLLHFAAMILFGVLLATASDETSGNSLFHPYLGIAAGLLFGGYVLYLALSHRLMLLRGLKETPRRQATEASQVISHYVSRRPYPEATLKGMGRHNILASYAGLLLLVGSIPLAAGGMLAAYAQPGFSADAALELHVLGLAPVGLFLLLHLFAVLNPDNWPLTLAMFSSGRVPLVWVQEHMPAALPGLVPPRTGTPPEV